MGQAGENIGNAVHDPYDQTNVIRFLEKGAGRGSTATRIDTHGALIFLIGDEAFKIKRAVKFDYMDLSTPEKRHALLDREFELNKPAAPSIYRDVVPLVRKPDGELALDAIGEVLEWILLMNRFPVEAELTYIAKTSGINDELALKLGQSIADYHTIAPVKDLDGASLIQEILDELDTVLGQMSEVFDGDAKVFSARSRKVWEVQLKQLHQRSRLKHIRRCHGDLHLRNIVLIDGIPTPFDALEFDERLGTCDTLYDLAFLLMDLDHLGMPHAANQVMNAYFATATDKMADAGLSLLPLYLSIRAAIRAMVDVQTSNVSAKSVELQQDARAYLTQALGYLEPTPPILFAIGGYSGTGKTTIARAVVHQIGAAPGAFHVRSDVVRKVLLKRDPLDHLGPDGYKPEITAKTYATARKQANAILEQGHSVILDAVHSDPKDRLDTEKVARANCSLFLGIWLESPTETRLSRVATRAPDASDANAAVVNRQAKVDPGPMTWHRVDTDQPIDAVVQNVSALIRSLSETEPAACGGRYVG